MLTPSNASVARYANDLNNGNEAIDASNYNCRYKWQSKYRGLLIGKKNIQVGEELYVDYVREYWRKKKIQ